MHMTLYIDGQRADLSNDSLVTMSYAQTDAESPTAVKNSFSQSVSLPGTPANNAIFSHIYRGDHTADDGTFDPNIRTPFLIMNQQAQILERGYLKLESIERKGTATTYKVTLYGGLGELLYALSYDTDGKELTLADLDYGTDISFSITATAVRQAWRTLQGLEQEEKWRVLNFAPAYNGVISTEFDADKALIKPAAIGMSDSEDRYDEQEEVDVNYRTAGGYSQATLAEEYADMSTCDLRSYLQRPVVSVAKIMEAIQRKAQEIGRPLNFFGKFFSSPYYLKTWLTLPRLTELAGATAKRKERMDEGLETSRSVFPNGRMFQREMLPATRIYPEGKHTEVSAIIDVALLASGVTAIYLTPDRLGVFVQLVGYKSGSAVAWSPMVALTRNGGLTEAVADLAGVTAVGELYGPSRKGTFTPLGVGEYRWHDADAVAPLQLSFETDADMDDVRIQVTVKPYLSRPTSAQWTEFLDERGASVAIDSVRAFSSSAWLEYDGTDVVRSEAFVTPDVLFADTDTPADYLLAMAKTFGLVFLYDKESGTTTLMSRDEYYQGGVDVSLDERIDEAQAVTITPVVPSHKWVEMSHENEDGEWAEMYATKYGHEYGRARMVTANDFDRDAQQLLSVSFKGACEVLERRKYYNTVTEGGKPVPSVFLDGGVEYKLYKNGQEEGDTITLNATKPTSLAQITYRYPQFPGYDAESKVQLHGADEDPEDGTNVLLFYNGSTLNGYQGFALTDDTELMFRLNGRPCWLLPPAECVDPQFRVALNSFALPRFQRYEWSGRNIVRALDMGTPAELDIPLATYEEGAPIFGRCWQGYLQDMYAGNARKLSAVVDLRGMIVGQNLLRNMYYFRGAWWVMTAISNYDLAKDAICRCEFIRVTDKDNYTDSQNY